MQYCTVQYNTIQYNAMQYNAMQYNTILCLTSTTISILSSVDQIHLISNFVLFIQLSFICHIIPNQFLPFSQLSLHVHVHICDRSYTYLRPLFYTFTSQSAANMMGVLLSQEMKAKGDKSVLMCALFSISLV